MKSFLPCLVCVLALPAFAAEPVAPSAADTAQPATTIPESALPIATQLRERALAGSVAYDLVESLTTEVGPRMAGSPGDAKAVRWAEARFKALGFDRVELEPVTVQAWRRGAASAEVESPFAQSLTLAALGGSVGTQGTLRAEVVEFADFTALKNAPADSLHGKIAYVSFRMQRKRDGSGYGPAVAARGTGASEAAKKGAVAFLLRSVGTDRDRMPHTGAMRYEEGVARIPAAALSNPDADLLSNMIRRGQPVRLALAIDAGFTGPALSHNVIGEIRGRERPDEVVLLASHLDSWDLGTGAIDDGAGVAITMAAAALIGDLPQAPKRTIRVVAYANEEHGLDGGKTYAAARANQVEQHILGVESDFGAGRIYGFASNAVPHAQGALKQIADALRPLDIDWFAGQGGPGADIGPMTKLGMRWAWLGQDGSDYFDWHHTANDTLDKVDAKALDQQVAAYAVFAYLVAEADGDFGSAPLPVAAP
jgi:carboxypeptidase Q